VRRCQRGGDNSGCWRTGTRCHRHVGPLQPRCITRTRGSSWTTRWCCGFQDPALPQVRIFSGLFSSAFFLSWFSQQFSLFRLLLRASSVILAYNMSSAVVAGEDVMELHVHGGPAVVRATLAALADLPDFRIAQPGVVPSPPHRPNSRETLTTQQATASLHDGLHANASAQFAHIMGHALVSCCPTSASPTDWL